mgnify:CR=1 FL=1
MAQTSPQTFANHARIVPAYHYVAFPLFAINFFYALYEVVTAFSWGKLVAFGVSCGLAGIAAETGVVMLVYLNEAYADGVAPVKARG